MIQNSHAADTFRMEVTRNTQFFQSFAGYDGRLDDMSSANPSEGPTREKSSVAGHHKFRAGGYIYLLHAYFNYFQTCLLGNELWNIVTLYLSFCSVGYFFFSREGLITFLSNWYAIFLNCSPALLSF